MSERREDEELVELCRAWGEAEADMIRGLLEANGISSAVRGESTRITHGFTLDGLAEVRILVRRDDADQARQLIAEAGKGLCPGCDKPAGQEDPDCPVCGAAPSEG